MPAHTPSPAVLAQGRLAARARRINLIRKRVVAVALATFALAFGVIAYDGSMGTTTATTASTTSNVESADSSSSSSSGTASGSESSSMTTRQS